MADKTLDRKLPVSDRRWHVAEDHVPYDSENELSPPGCHVLVPI